MPFIIDDIILRYDPVGILRVLGGSIPPFDMLWLMEQIEDKALHERFNPKKIADKIKNNRLMYEIEEISEEEYKRENERLNHDLKVANSVNNMNSKKILG